MKSFFVVNRVELLVYNFLDFKIEMQIEMEDLTEPGDSNRFKRTQDTVRSGLTADSGIDTGTTTGRISAATNQASFPQESGMGEVIQELQQNFKPQNTDEKRVSEEVTADEISKLTKLNDKEKTREIDVNNRIKEYRTVS